MDILQQKSWKILLIGDSCEDVYHYGVCERMSPEAPVPVFKEISKEVRGGMSMNVRHNLENFGLSVDHFHNQEVIRKNRFVESRYMQQLFRCDEGENERVKSFICPAKEDILKYDAIVISDYNKGFVTEKAFSQLRENTPLEIPIFVDSKKNDLSIFDNCIIKINNIEEAKATFGKNQEIIVTLGKQGAKWRSNIYPAEKVDVYDVCGAGDVFLASLVYGWLKYEKSLESGILLANKCSSLSVTKSGTYVITKEDILKILEN